MASQFPLLISAKVLRTCLATIQAYIPGSRPPADTFGLCCPDPLPGVFFEGVVLAPMMFGDLPAQEPRLSRSRTARETDAGLTARCWVSAAAVRPLPGLTNSAKSTRAIIHGNPVVTAIATSPFS
jgi:hypothetical protein